MWHLFAGPQLLLVLLGLLVLALVLTTIIPQIPLQAMDTPLAWLAVQPGIVGQYASLLHTLGLVDIFHAWWFRLLLALTGLGLFVRLVESSEIAWRGSGRAPWKPASFSFWGRYSPQIVLPSELSAEETHSQVRQMLKAHGTRESDVAGAPGPSLVASRRPFALFARPVFYGALLIVLVGLAAGSYWGWQNQTWIPVPGESRTIGHGSAYKIRLDSLERSHGERAETCEAASQLTWLEGDVEIARAVASTGQPARLQGISVRQVGLLPIATVRGQDDAGRALSFQLEEDLGATTELKIEMLSQGDQYPVQIVGHDSYLVLTLDQANAQGEAALRAALLAGRQLELQLSDADYQTVAEAHKGGTVTLDNLEIRANLDFRPILRVDYHPAMPLVLGGLAVALLALLVGWLAGPHLVWIAIEAESETAAAVRLLDQPSARGSRYLPQLATQLQEGLGHDA